VAVPKRKHSTGRKGKRRSAISLPIPQMIACPDCHQLKKPHLVCPNCGFYKETKKKQ
jgi:large subunit ribosomal protein L32